MVVDDLFRCEKVDTKWILITKNFEKSSIAFRNAIRSFSKFWWFFSK